MKLNSTKTESSLLSLQIKQMLPSLATPDQMLKNIKKIAIPAIIIAGATLAQTADGGPITYGICVAGCIAINPAWGAICPVLCLGAVGAPGP